MLKTSSIICAALISTPLWAGHELDRRDLDRGRVLYLDNCASCHGVNLEGQPNWRDLDEGGVMQAPPHDETGHTWHHDNRLLFNYTKLGGDIILDQMGVTGVKSGMPGFGDLLRDDEILDVLGLIRSTWPERMQQMQASRNPPHDR